MTKRQRQIDVRRRCIIAATIEPLIPFRRGFGHSKMGPFFENRTVQSLVSTGELRVVKPSGRGKGRHTIFVTARAA